MKKTLSLACLLALFAGAAHAAPYYLPQPAGGALIPYDMQPVYSLEGLYNWTARHGLPDTAGGRLRFNLYNNAESTVRHQFSIAAGYEAGRRSASPADLGSLYHGLLAEPLGEYLPGVPEVESASIRLELEKLPITLGYDLNIALTDHLLLDFGARGGYAFGFVRGHVRDLVAAEHSLPGYKEHLTTGGCTFALIAGLKIQFSESIYGHLAYEFGRTYYTKHLPHSLNFSQHGVVLGFGVLF